MHRLVPHLGVALLFASCLAECARAQNAFTWQEVRDKFEATNPTLQAGKLNISESRALEITAFLRPNPDLTMTLDQFDPFSPNPYRPFTYLLPFATASYLHERQHKRELRLESAKKATGIAESSQEDLERTLLFSLRGAFVQTLQAKAVLQAGPGQPGVLGQGPRGEPRPFQSRRYRTDRSRPPGVAARAIRIRPADRRSEPANGQNPASDAFE